MSEQIIATIVSSILGYGGVAIALERLRKEFAAYKVDQSKKMAQIELVLAGKADAETCVAKHATVGITE